MDLNNKGNEELKIQRKLKNTVNKIKRNRRNSKKLKKETQQFQEIKKLLSTSATESPRGSDRGSFSLKIVSNSLSSCLIPITAPAVEVFAEDKAFSLFDEDGICLRDFLNGSEDTEEQHCTVFGKDSKVPNESLVRDLIAHRITESILPNEESSRSICLYVLYLLSVHANKRFASACFDFLKHRRFLVSAVEILPIFVNFGSTLESLTGSKDEIEFPVVKSARRRSPRGRRCFPYHNAEMVAKFLLYYASLDLIKKEPELKILLRAVTRLTLDRKIRSSHLVSVYSALIGALASKLALILDVSEVVSCLHLDTEHVLNQVEIARIVLTPSSPRIHQLLLTKTIDFILKPKLLKISESLKIRDVILILKELKKKQLTPLEIYCILQLVNGSLPSVTATAENAGDINNLLVCLEASFFDVKDSIDLIRLKLEIAKLRNMVTTNIATNDCTIDIFD